MGTTQRVGCAGDFCHYDTSLADVDGDGARLDRASKLSEFRKKIMDGDGAARPASNLSRSSRLGDAGPFDAISREVICASFD